MAFITQDKRGGFEVRESRATPTGPRSRTLATFRELDAATIAKALARAENPPTAAGLRAAALRAGAPVAAGPADRAAKDTLRELARGEPLDPRLRRLLLDALTGESRSASEWLGVLPAERGAALEDLLSLADAMPIRRRPREIGFPRIDSR